MHKQISAIALALGATFSAGAFAADGMSREAYKAEKDKIEATAKSDKKACDGMKDNAKDICQAEAKAKEKVAKAELDARNKPGAKADENLALMKAEGAYEVAKEKCEDNKDNAAACKKDAKTAYDKVKADVRATARTTDKKS